MLPGAGQEQVIFLAFYYRIVNHSDAVPGKGSTLEEPSLSLPFRTGNKCALGLQPVMKGNARNEKRALPRERLGVQLVNTTVQDIAVHSSQTCLSIE